MTRSLRVLVALLVTAVGVAACSSSTKATSTPSSATSEPSVRTITLKAVEHDISIKQSGNTVTIVNDLMSNGRKIGQGQVECFLSGRGRVAMCLGAAVLPNGQILSQASLSVPPPVGKSIDAIVGGTGTYATARGTIDLQRATLTGDTDLTFHIVVDS
jgi:hypothetical protein